MISLGQLALPDSEVMLAPWWKSAGEKWNEVERSGIKSLVFRGDKKMDDISEWIDKNMDLDHIIISIADKENCGVAVFLSL